MCWSTKLSTEYDFEIFDYHHPTILPVPKYSVTRESVMDATRLRCLLGLAILCTFIMTRGSGAACPDGCACNTEGRQVNCTRAGLTGVPEDMSSPERVTELILKNNNIDKLGKKSL